MNSGASAPEWGSDNDTNTNVLAGGTITGDVVFDNATHAGDDLTWDMSDKALEFDDNVKATFGDDKDLQIYHTGVNGRIENRTSHLYIRNNTDDDDGGNIYIQAKTTEHSIICKDDEGVELYYDDSQKLATTSGGINVTGTTTDDGADHAGDVTFQGDGANTNWDKSADSLIFNDSAYAKWGTGSDFRIHHNGTLTLLDNATGNLQLRSAVYDFRDTSGNETILKGTENGAVELYYDNVKELETKSGGVKLLGCSEAAFHDGGSISSDPTLNLGTTNFHKYTLGANVTFINPTTEAVGQSGSIVITQDGTGSRTAAWGNQFKWAGGTAPTLSTAANAVDRIDYLVVAADTIHCVASLDIK